MATTAYCICMWYVCFVHVCVHICNVSFFIMHFIVIALIEKEKATEKPKLVLLIV